MKAVELVLLSTTLNYLPDNIWMLKHLKSLKLNLCVWLEKLPEDLGRLECLEKLNFSYIKISHLPDMLKHLKSLQLRFCCFLEKLPEDLGRLESLALSCTMIKELPDSICMLKHLKSLELISCSLLEKLPEDLGGQLECLEKCKFLQGIPNSIGKMKCLRYFHLPYCIRVEKLPEELGSFECLKELDIQGSHVNYLNQAASHLSMDHIYVPLESPTITCSQISGVTN
ncbi:disease resistance protein RPV1 isoform X1 [Lactuca sativa]|uniref:disease resistance protein RPV1 isoform X1 n=1 Tax=Lactuca sativa TaxID=4236 RepID=UPI000CD9AB48|nr:disease resistance protein RPV1 isoform X1 [Lactuca sativa]